MKSVWGPWTALVSSVLFVATFVAPARSEKGERKVALDQVPETVRKAIVKEVGKGRLVDIGEFAGAKETVYEIEMIADGKEYDVLFAPDGSVRKRTYEGAAKEGAEDDEIDAERSFQDEFDLDHRDLATTGRSRFFVLEPGYRLTLAGKEGDRTVTLQITVLDETKTIGGTETRVVEERESADGELVEVSRNFLAFCKRSASVFYFGEEVDVYRNGKIVDHEGAWMHGKDGARAGLMMPGEPALGARYYQEVAPGIAMDRAEIVDTEATLETPAGTFKHCLKMREENPLDGEREFKIHAPGIGLVQDEDLLLVSYGFIKR